jgi:hypothetical protein
VKEVLDVGDRVRVSMRPGCKEDGIRHPIAPVANKLAGWVMQADMSPHGYLVQYAERVSYDGLSVGHGYYSREELELL